MYFSLKLNHFLSLIYLKESPLAVIEKKQTFTFTSQLFSVVFCQSADHFSSPSKYSCSTLITPFALYLNTYKMFMQMFSLILAQFFSSPSTLFWNLTLLIYIIFSWKKLWSSTPFSKRLCKVCSNQIPDIEFIQSI